jgi:hypothetical protein
MKDKAGRERLIPKSHVFCKLRSGPAQQSEVTETVSKSFADTPRRQVSITSPLPTIWELPEKASGPSSIHVEPGIVDLDSNELNFLP